MTNTTGKISDDTAATTLTGVQYAAIQSGSNVRVPNTLLDAAYQPFDADLTSWAAVARASGFDAWVATPSSANLASLVTGETGSGSLVFATSPTLVTPTLGVAAATSINFGQDALNYYDEGTFTPAFSASGATFNHSTQTGVYTRIGNTVTFGITIQLAATGNTLTANPITITGLPFTSNATTPSGGSAIFFATTTSYIQVAWRIFGAATSVTLYGITAAATTNATVVNSDALCHATNQTFLVINGSYRA